MKNYLKGLALGLQWLFTQGADELARSTHFLRRQRKLSASACAQVLVFQWMGNGKATLESMAEELDLSPQALQQHLGPQAHAWLRALLELALAKALRVPRQASGLLDRFRAVIVEDATTLALPPPLADAFPGCGGGTQANEGAAAAKVLVRWDVTTGQVHALTVHAGCTSDQTLAADATQIPDGGLHLADQGFFNTGRWKAYSPTQYWISRVPAATKVCYGGVWQTLETLLADVSGDLFDAMVLLVETTRLSCRLTARRCPPQVANRRRQKLRKYTRSKKGREPSARQLALCEWTVLATNVSGEALSGEALSGEALSGEALSGEAFSGAWLSAKEVWLVYRCRWQVELLFKRARQQTGWGFSWGRNRDRLLVELYAKLLAWVVLHWAALLRGAPLGGVSSWKRHQRAQTYATWLMHSLAQGVATIMDVLTVLQQRLERIRPQRPERTRTNTRQTLLHPNLSS